MKIKETEHGTLIEDIQSAICDMITYDELADKYLELLDENERLREALKDIAEDDSGCRDSAYKARQTLRGAE
jgi:hypothetical protein